jgi:hypothetical protein
MIEEKGKSVKQLREFELLKKIQNKVTKSMRKV